MRATAATLTLACLLVAGGCTPRAAVAPPAPPAPSAPSAAATAPVAPEAPAGERAGTIRLAAPAGVAYVEPAPENVGVLPSLVAAMGDEVADFQVRSARDEAGRDLAVLLVTRYASTDVQGQAFTDQRRAQAQVQGLALAEERIAGRPALTAEGPPAHVSWVQAPDTLVVLQGGDLPLLRALAGALLDANPPAA